MLLGPAAGSRVFNPLFSRFAVAPTGLGRLNARALPPSYRPYPTLLPASAVSRTLALLTQVTHEVKHVLWMFFCDLAILVYKAGARQAGA